MLLNKSTLLLLSSAFCAAHHECVLEYARTHILSRSYSLSRRWPWYGFCRSDARTVEENGNMLVKTSWSLSKFGPRMYVMMLGLDVWAPDLEYFNDRVWLYHSISMFNSKTSAIFLASADSIDTRSWRDDGLILKSADDYNVIDPSLAIDKDGNPGVAFGSHWDGLMIVSVDPKNMCPDGEIIAIASRNNYENSMEAASIIYQPDTSYYYLLFSIDYCCLGISSTYRMAVSRSKDITGPYIDKESKPVIKHPTAGTTFDTGNDRWIDPGYQDIDDQVIAQHAYDATEDGTSKLLISDLKFDKDGWPAY